MGYFFIRNLVYKVIYDANKPAKATNDLTTREKALIASISGGLAAFLTTPFDLINTRIIHDATRPKEFRFGYTSLGDGYSKLSAKGNSALFEGARA